MAGGRRKYTREFKVDAIKRVVEDGQPQRQVAADLGISPNTLSSWKRAYLQDPNQAFPGNGRQKSEESELVRLRRELSAARRENEFLKKVAGFFARERK